MEPNIQAAFGLAAADGGCDTCLECSHPVGVRLGLLDTGSGIATSAKPVGAIIPIHLCGRG
jgi:hypothetical protein